MQSLIRSKSAGVTGGRGTAGAGPGRDLLYHKPPKHNVAGPTNKVEGQLGGSPRTPTLRCTPPLTLCIPPLRCDMVCLHDLAARVPSDQSFFPFSWHLASPRWWEDLGIAAFHPTFRTEVHIPDITKTTFYTTSSLQWYRGASCAPPFISSEPPLSTEHLSEHLPPHGVMGNPDPAPDRVGHTELVHMELSSWSMVAG